MGVISVVQGANYAGKQDWEEMEKFIKTFYFSYGSQESVDFNRKLQRPNQGVSTFILKKYKFAIINFFVALFITKWITNISLHEFVPS